MLDTAIVLCVTKQMSWHSTRRMSLQVYLEVGENTNISQPGPQKVPDVRCTALAIEYQEGNDSPIQGVQGAAAPKKKSKLFEWELYYTNMYCFTIYLTLPTHVLYKVVVRP